MRVGRPVERLRPDRPVGPVLHFSNRPDHARVDPLTDLPGALPRVPLIAHLRHDALGAGHVGERARLGNRPRQRLLAVDVLSAPHRLHRDDRVRVIRCRDNDRVEVGLPIEHPAIVGVARGRRILPEHRGGVARIDVTQRDDVLARTPADIGAPATANANARDVERVARGPHAPSQHVSRDERRGDCRRDSADEPATRDAVVVVHKRLHPAATVLSGGGGSTPPGARARCGCARATCSRTRACRRCGSRNRGR